MKKKLKVAVTGGIGSGKTAFCSILAQKSFPVINVDSVSKEILITDNKVKSSIIKAFGKDSYTNNTINKKFLAKNVFSKPENVLKINSIVHPKVIEKINILMNEKLKKHYVVFAEAALIYEANMEDIFDYVVLVTADDNIKMQRKIEHDNYTEEEFIKRRDNQIPDEEKKKRADFIFLNNGTLEQLKEKVNLLINILNGLITTNG